MLTHLEHVLVPHTHSDHQVNSVPHSSGVFDCLCNRSGLRRAVGEYEVQFRKGKTKQEEQKWKNCSLKQQEVN